MYAASPTADMVTSIDSSYSGTSVLVIASYRNLNEPRRSASDDKRAPVASSSNSKAGWQAREAISYDSCPLSQSKFHCAARPVRVA